MKYGVINVFKEAGMTSFQVVYRLRKLTGEKKIGHTGTLDPDATGVLPVCIGKATKLVDFLMDSDKQYKGRLLCGRKTDTQDISGQVLKESSVTCSEADVRECLSGFLGEQEQIPPMYSAKKQNGKRLYQLAREGVVVERKPSRIRIEALEMLSCELPRVSLRIRCSKGTYIRTLCHDIGQKLGCGGCMEQLTRTKVGQFSIENAVTLREIEERVHAEKVMSENRQDPGFRADGLDDILIGIDTIFEALPAVYVPKDASGKEADRLLHNGNPLPAETAPDDGAAADGAAADSAADDRVRIYDSEDIFLGVYRYRPEKKAYYPDIFVYEPAGREQTS